MVQRTARIPKARDAVKMNGESWIIRLSVRPSFRRVEGKRKVSSSIPKLFYMCLRKLVLFFPVGMLVCCLPVQAQTLTVRLLNAKSGKPMRRQNVTFGWDKNLSSSQVMVGDDGTGRVEVPSGADEFVLLAGPRIGNEPYRTAYRNCNDQASLLIRISDVLQKGYVPKNVCANKSIATRPGEVVFWALPRPLIDLQ